MYTYFIRFFKSKAYRCWASDVKVILKSQMLKMTTISVSALFTTLHN